MAITIGPDLNIWYVEPYTRDIIGRLTPDGQITEYPLPSAAWIINGPDGHLWFAATSAHFIGSIDPTAADPVSTIQIYDLPGADPNAGNGGDAVRGLTFDKQGNLWMADGDRLNPRFYEFNPLTEQASTVLDPVSGSFPYGMTLGLDGSLWFTDSHNDEIGEITIGTDGSATVTEYPLPIPIGGAIITDTRGNIWFSPSVFGSNTIGEVQLVPDQPPNPSVVLRNAAGAVTTTFTEGDTVTFDASGTTDPEGDAVTYQWDLNGDGTFDATGAQATRSFALSGVYPVTLKATDSFGLSSTETIDVTVNQRPPVIGIGGIFTNDGTNYLTITPGTAVNLFARVLNRNSNDSSVGDSYTWTVTKNGVPYASGTGSLSFIPDATATYVATFVLTNPYGTATASQSVNVVIPPGLSLVQLTSLGVNGGLTPVGSTIYFEADDGIHGNQVWRTDGRPGDTVPVDHGSQPLDGPIGFLATQVGRAHIGSWFYFFTDNGNGNYTLWRNDGSASPNSASEELQTVPGVTLPSGDTFPVPLQYGPYQLTAVGHDLYFGAYSADGVWYLWKTTGADGANPSTAPFLYPGFLAYSSWYSDIPWDLHAAGSELYFEADYFHDGTIDNVAWGSDGTPAGTAPLRDSSGGLFVAGFPVFRDEATVGNVLYGITDDGTLWHVSGFEASSRVGWAGRSRTAIGRGWQ